MPKTPLQRKKTVKKIKVYVVVSTRNRINMAYESYSGNGDYELCIYKEKSFAEDNCCETFEKVVEAQLTYKI